MDSTRDFGHWHSFYQPLGVVQRTRQMKLSDFPMQLLEGLVESLGFFFFFLDNINILDNVKGEI